MVSIGKKIRRMSVGCSARTLAKLAAMSLLLLLSSPSTVMGRITTGTSAATSTEMSGQHRRADVNILQASKIFQKSPEALYDHVIKLVTGLEFHWNDPGEDNVGSNVFSGRLVHVSENANKAATWLGLGVYDSYANPAPKPSDKLMIGSEAIIGIVDSSDVAKYYLQARKSGVGGVEKMEDARQTLIESSIVQHDGDDGSVTTILNFEKKLEEDDNEEIKIKHMGLNTFIFAVGSSNGGSGLAFHDSRGAFQLDFDEIKKMAEKGQSGSDYAIDTNTDKETSTGAYDPVALTACTSDDPSYLHMVQVDEKIKFHWNLDVWSNSNPPTINGKLEFEGQAWLGFGFSSDGSMIGSDAIIGIPHHAEYDRPLKYKLTDKTKEALTPMPKNQQTLIDSDITQTDKVTVLTFKKLLSESNRNELTVTAEGMNTFIYAVGTSNTFGYHQYRGSFDLDLSRCDSPLASSHPRKGVSHKNQGGWATHGVIAALAWAVAIPAAITTAWFRTIVPSSWIYIHVFSNVAGFFLTLITFIVAVVTMSLADEPAHFSEPHHIVGLVMLLLVTFQVMNGFLRPPVEKREVYNSDNEGGWQSMLSIPKTARGIWHLSHRCTGVSLLAFGIWQVQDGLNLFADKFGYHSMAPFFYGYVILIALAALGVKVWSIQDDRKAKQQAASSAASGNGPGRGSRQISSVAVHNGIDPDSELVPVQFEMQ